MSDCDLRSVCADLSRNNPILADEHTTISSSLAAFARGEEGVAAALQAFEVRGDAAVRRRAARLWAPRGWYPNPDGILFTGGCKQALSGIIAALTGPGDAIGLECLTYPAVKRIAEQLSLTVLPIEMDEEGIVPESLEAAHRRKPFKLLYVQPTLHNPLGACMSQARRRAIAKLLQDKQVLAIEDEVNGFLSGDGAPPIAAHAPDNCIVVDSFAKRVAPGVNAGVVTAPTHLVTRLANALQLRALSPPALQVLLALHLLEDGTAARIESTKREDAAARQRLARKCLHGHRVIAHPASYFCWLQMRAPWSSEGLVSAAASRGIRLSPAHEFCVADDVPRGVRISLSAVPIPRLDTALRAVSTVLEQEPPR
jgi:DNA-binding transcriptional MocR family regulator